MSGSLKSDVIEAKAFLYFIKTKLQIINMCLD